MVKPCLAEPSQAKQSVLLMAYLGFPSRSLPLSRVVYHVRPTQAFPALHLRWHRDLHSVAPDLHLSKCTLDPHLYSVICTFRICNFQRSQ